MAYPTSTETGENITINTNDTWAPDPSGPFELVRTRFEATLANSEAMLELLTGDGGYLDQMAEAVGDAPDVSMVSPNVDTSLTLVDSGLTPPSFDRDDLGDFPEETYLLEPLDPLPDIDTTGIDAIARPTPLADASLSWSAAAYSSSVYTALLSRILNDLITGETGIDPVAEQAIYDRARTRQQADRQSEYEAINNTWIGKQFMLPSGSLVSALTDFGIAANRQDADIENNIIATQADLAQKNSQFIIQQAAAIDGMLRQFHSDNENRELDFEKNRVDLLVREYAERVRGFVAEVEGEKARIQALVEVLRGTIESNRAKVETYKEQYAALAVRVGAVAAKNESLVKVYQGEVAGYSEAERAVAEKNESLVKRLTAQIAGADLDLRASIAQVEAAVSAYGAETSVKERIATAMANIAAQSVASWASAVNASAGLSYSGSESISESREQRKSISHSHSYEHDPVE